MTRFGIVPWLSLAGLVGAGVVAVVIVPSAESGDTADCPPGIQRATFLATPPVELSTLKFVSPPDGTIIRLRFDDSKRPQKMEFPFNLAPPATAPRNGLNNEEGLNARFGGSERLTGPGDRYIWPVGSGVQMSLTRWSRDKVGVCLRLDPASVAVPPGSYRGTVGVAFQDEVRALVAVEATFRDRWERAALITFLGAVLGLVVKILSEASAMARSGGISGRQAVREYTTQLTFFVTLILAAISAVFTYVVLYLHDPDWGADANDGLRLFAACFIVQMSSSEALAVVSRFAGGTPIAPRPM